MNSSKRQLVLLAFLSIIFVFLANFNMFTNWEKEKTALTVKSNDLDGQMNMIKMKLNEYEEMNQNTNGEKDENENENENSDVTESTGIRKQIEIIMEKFISTVKQEEVIVLMESLNNDNNFEIFDFNFNIDTTDYVSEIPPEELSEDSSEVNIDSSIDTEIQNTIDNYFTNLSFTISFVSDYESVVGYIKRINDLNRSIFIKGVNISSHEVELGTNLQEEDIKAAKSIVSGEMLIKVITLNNYAGVENENEIENIDFGEGLAGGTNPFIPYNSYIAKLAEESIAEIDVDSESEIVVTEYEKFINITGFEKEDHFFVGSPKDVKGSVGLNKNSYSGLWSGEIVYNFVNGALTNTANLVFDKKILVLEDQIEKLSLKIFSPQYSYHTIGLVILDSSGKQHDIVFSDGVYWTDWNTLEASTDGSINYPAVVSRIYVTDNGEKSNLSGYYLFDDLEVLYTKDVLGDDE